MPVVNKSVPPKPKTAPRPKSSGGGVLDEAIDVADLEDIYIKALLYGKNRIGKTTLACCFPKPLLLIAVEPTPTGGARSVKNVKGVKVIRVTGLPDRKDPTALFGSAKLEAIALDLRDKPHPYKTVVLDGSSGVQEIFLQEILGEDSAPQTLAWGTITKEQYMDRATKTKEMLKKFVDLQCHMVIIAHEKDHNPPEGFNKATKGLQTESWVAANLGQATVEWLHNACDFVGQLYEDRETRVDKVPMTVAGKVKYNDVVVDTGRRVRRLRTGYHMNFAAGFRAEYDAEAATKDPNYTPVPDFIQGSSPQDMYEKFMALVKGVK